MSAGRLRVVMPFVYRTLPSFVRADVQSMSARHDVTVVPSRSVMEALRAARAVTDASVVLCWFGSLRYLPAVIAARLVGRPVVIVAGGYDVASLPQIDYGNMRGGPVRWAGRLLFRLATLVLPYSHAGESEARTNAGVPANKLRMVYLGFDADDFGEDVPIAAKEQFVLAVGAMDASSIVRKGIVTLLRASRLLPDVRFVVVGGADAGVMTILRSFAGPNVEFTGFVDDQRLRTLYRAAKVYCQPSLHEAFACSVAEAMLFNALPVVSDRGSLPEVAGGSGVFVSADEPAALAAALRDALGRETYGPLSPRAHIIRAFPAARRAAALDAILEELT